MYGNMYVHKHIMMCRLAYIKAFKYKDDSIVELTEQDFLDGASKDDEQISFDSLIDFFSEPFHFPDEIGDGSSSLAASSGDVQDDAFFSYLGIEEFNQFSPFAGSQPIDPETLALSILGGRTQEKRRREVWAKHLNDACATLDGTLDENQLILFRELFARFYGIFAAAKENAQSIKDSISYFFSKKGSIEKEDDVPFEDLLLALGSDIRPDYIRLRLIYKIWKSGWSMPPLPFFYTPVPLFIENKMDALFNRNKDIIFHEGWTLGNATLLMELLWQHIGISKSELLELYMNRDDSLNSIQVEKMLNMLVDARIISVQTHRRERITDLKKKILGHVEEVEADIPRVELSEPRFYLIGDNPEKLVSDIWEHEKRIVNTTFMSVFAFVS